MSHHEDPDAPPALSRPAICRLKREYMRLQEDPPPGITAQPEDTSSLAQWTATIDGPRDSPFAGATFQVSIRFPVRYPIEPPSCQFVGNLIPYHPNLDEQGRICLDTLKRPPSGAWSPAVSLPSLLLSLQLLLGEPNAEDGLVPEISALYQASKEKWKTEAKRRLTEQLAGQQRQTLKQPNIADNTPTSSSHDDNTLHVHPPQKKRLESAVPNNRDDSSKRAKLRSG